MSAVAERIRELYDLAARYPDWAELEQAITNALRVDRDKAISEPETVKADLEAACHAINIKPRRTWAGCRAAIRQTIIDRKASYDRCSFRTDVVPMP